MTRSPVSLGSSPAGEAPAAIPVRRTPPLAGTPRILAGLALLVPGLAGPLAGAAQDAPPRVRVVTSAGSIVAELYPDRAPATVANFLRYVEAGAFAGGSFYRTVRDDNQPDDPVTIDVIQGGVAREARRYPPIALERTRDTGLRHVDGALSMARSGPDTARGEFFICVGDQPSLDFGGARNPDGQGFAVFGRVVEGMDVVRSIHGAPAREQRLDPPIPILRVERTGSGLSG